jgi:hypothetical protein
MSKQFCFASLDSHAVWLIRASVEILQEERIG